MISGCAMRGVSRPPSCGGCEDNGDSPKNGVPWSVAIPRCRAGQRMRGFRDTHDGPGWLADLRARRTHSLRPHRT